MLDLQLKILHKLCHDLSGSMIHRAYQDETRKTNETKVVTDLKMQIIL